MVFLEIKVKTQGFDISGKSACIIGCGGLGCNVAVHLVGAGIGKLLICDFDTVSNSNLNRQFLYNKKDIGKSKCITAKEKLIDYSDGTEILSFEKKIEKEEDLDFATECDIVILAVDNVEARKTVQQFCTEKKIPLVCGGIDGFYGMCYLYLPSVSPCPDCAGMNTNDKAEFNISSTAGIIGSAQSALATEYLLTKNEDLAGKILLFDQGNFDTLKIKSRLECPICRKTKQIL